MVKCIPQGTFEPKEFAGSLGGSTDQNGKFVFGTYESGDGLPPGDYVLTFTWPPYVLKRSATTAKDPQDRLNGKYDTVDKSPLKFTVEKGKPLTLETIDLKTT